MSYIIDRRLNGKNKSTVNRQRFLKRYRKQIQKSVSDAVDQRNMSDIEQGESITIPKKDLSEPRFHHGQGGNRDIVHPGNKEFMPGDRQDRPEGGGGGGSGQGDASDGGEGDDDFVFQISQKEFLEFMFEDLELPNMVKRQLLSDDEYSLAHGGITEVGNPNQLNIGRSMRSAHARRIALGGKKRRRRKVVCKELEELAALTEPMTAEQEEQKQALDVELEMLNKKLKVIPFIDEFDLKYNFKIKQPQPSSKAVMFCVMDVSGSMTQEIKDTAKRFFFLLYLFLQRNYSKIEVVFLRHHTQAAEVSEEDFFYSRETGGTVVSSALQLMDQIIKERYPADQWNIYGAQATDGDNWQGDQEKCRTALAKHLLPAVQYFTYIEIGENDPQELWHLMELLKKDFSDRLAVSKVRNNSEIFPVFRKLFKKQVAK